MRQMGGGGAFSGNRASGNGASAGQQSSDPVREMWDREDRDGDGQVTWAEFGGPKGDVFGRLDTGLYKTQQPGADDTPVQRDNRLTFEEFNVQTAATIGKTPEQIREMFRNEDKNGDGVVTWREFSGPKLPPARANFFALIDADLDSELTLSEFNTDWHRELLQRAVSVEPGQLLDVEEMFNDMDANGDGVVSREEFTGQKQDVPEQLRERKQYAERLEQLFQRLDADQDNRVSRDEYLVEWNQAPSGQTLTDRFEQEDMDRDGFITLDEFGGPDQAVYRAWTPPDADDVLEQLDGHELHYEDPEELKEQLIEEMHNVEEAIEEHRRRGEDEHVQQATAILDQMHSRLAELEEAIESGAYDSGFQQDDAEDELRSVTELTELITIVEQAIAEHESRNEAEHVAEAKELLEELQIEMEEAKQEAQAGAAVENGAPAHQPVDGPILTDGSFNSLDANGDGRISRTEHSALLFAGADTNKNGHLDRSEFRGPQGQDGQPDLFADLDADGSDTVSLREFQADWHTPPDGLFENDDVDANGYVTRSEYETSTRRQNTDLDATNNMMAADSVFATLDTDHNGVLSREEFTVSAHVKTVASASDKTMEEASQILHFVFSDLDTDQDGVISPEEHAATRDGNTRRHDVVQRVEPTDEDRKVAASLNIFALLDLDNSGALHAREFFDGYSGLMGRYWQPEETSFSEADADSDGFVSKTEFPGRVKWTAPTLFRQLDTDDSGTLTFAEFSPDWHKLWIGRSMETVEQSWDNQDVDKDGYLTKKEFKLSFMLGAPQEPETPSWDDGSPYLNIFALLDVDNSNTVSADEFVVEWHSTQYGEHNKDIDIHKLFVQADLNEDGQLATVEFPGPTKWGRPSLFDLLDNDLDDSLSLKEYMTSWHKIWLGKHELAPNQAWKLLDVDSDRQLSRDEFKDAAEMATTEASRSEL